MTTTLEPAALPVPGPGAPLNERGLSWAALDGVPVVVKAGSGRHRSALRREAVVLRALGGRGAVRLLDVDDDDTSTRLVLRDEGGATLAGRSSGDRSLLATAHAVAAAVAELHRAGWAHTRLSADHVVVGEAGARLCALADAVALDGSSASRAALDDDLEALWSLLDGLTRRPVTDGSPGGPRSCLQRLSLRLHLRRSRLAVERHPAGGAAALATALGAGQRPAAGRDRRAGSDRRPPRRPARSLAIGAMVLLAPAVLLGLALARSDAARPRTARPSPSSAPVTAHSAGPCVGPACAGAVVSGRRVRTSDGRTFVVGLPGDRVAVGDWDCDGTPTVADLRPGSGELFEFRRWPTADDPTVDRRPVAAAGIRKLLRRGPDRCPQLWGRAADGATRRLLPVRIDGAGP